MNSPESTIAPSDLIDRYFPVLDHGFIALKDYMGSDQDIDQAARTSYGRGTRKVSETRFLIRYLMAHRHTTPFEMGEMKFHVGLPIFVERQWIRHRTASVNEYSARYSLMPLLFYKPEYAHLNTQSKKNRQGRTTDTLDQKMYDNFSKKFDDHREQAGNLYKDLISEDVAREQSRMDLPLSTYTYKYWKIDLHNLFHFLSLRCDSHAQWEIRVYADIIASMVKVVFPLCWEAFEDIRLNGSTFSLQDRKLLQYYISGVRADSSFQGGENLTNWAKAELGMSDRQIADFFVKISAPAAAKDYSLNLSDARDFSYFEEKISKACEDLPQT